MPDPEYYTKKTTAIPDTLKHVSISDKINNRTNFKTEKASPASADLLFKDDFTFDDEVESSFEAFRHSVKFVVNSS